MSKRAFPAEPPRVRLATEPRVLAQVLKDDGRFPNSHLPLLLYRNVVLAPEYDPAAAFERLFTANGWQGSWRNGIYSYHHYHSTAHEVLGVYQGAASVQFGGENGVVHQVHRGDIILIPAGVAHKNLGSSPDFGAVGAYPVGLDWDMNYGRAGERPRADQNIAQVPLPERDPVYGDSGPLREKWAQR